MGYRGKRTKIPTVPVTKLASDENTNMKVDQKTKAKQFKDLHIAEGIFVMPNAWNAGSAYMLEQAGFVAMGTTSAGIAFSLGLPDYASVLSRDTAFEETTRIVDAIDLPVSVDAENGYGHEPEIVAETIQLVGESGAVGASIEDYSSDPAMGLYGREQSVERIKAARMAADKLNFDFTLTARAECFLVGHPNPFEESVVRANLYREAGADCLYVPGVKDPETIAALARQIDGPLNVVMGLSGAPLAVTELEDLGVKRISIGGSLARATFGVIRRAAQEILDKGSFDYAAQQVPDAELCEMFATRIEPGKPSG